MPEDYSGCISQLLFIPFVDILNYLATHANQRGLKQSQQCAICYTWPITAEEQGLHERVLRLAEDLKSVGISAHMDLTHPTTHFKSPSSTTPQTTPRARSNSLLPPISHSLNASWITFSDTILLLGSPSYASRASDSSTFTHYESQVLTAKHTAQPQSVIPLLMAGNFGNAFPPGYNSTLGANISSHEMYFQNFPEVIATILRIRLDKPVVAKLRSYRKYTEELLLRATALPNKERAKFHAQYEIQHKSLAAKLLVLKSHLTSSQINMLDGKISASEVLIEDYCKRITTGWEKIEVPKDITEGTASLESRLLDFLHNTTEKVLLLQAPARSNKTQSAIFVAYRAWKDLNWVPVVVDLEKLQTIDERCVSHTLNSHQLDESVISHAQAHNKFLLVVEGFDKCKCQINFYVCNSLKNWNGKVVFTCGSEYIGKSAQAPFYFMPADSNQRQQPQALKIINYSTAHSVRPVVDESSSNLGCEVLESLVIEAAVNKPNRAREHWHKALAEIKRKKTFIFQYSTEMRMRLSKGFTILQQDIIRPVFEDFMAKLAQLKVAQGGDFSKQAFISYAWPIAKADCTALQTRLLGIVQDMGLAGIEVLLDILRLSVGVDINEFMQTGIEKSDSIFWIGTPRLVERISFNDDGTPANPATTEFSHICKKLQGSPHSMYPLWFLGKTLDNSFPPLKVGSSIMTQTVLDFRDERDYFKTLPQLAASVLEIDTLQEYQQMFSDYNAQIRATEATFTTASILKRLETAEKDTKLEAARMEGRLKQLLSKIPWSLLRELEGMKEAQVKVFHSLLAQIRTKFLSKSSAEAQGLDLYIPLKGGAQLDTPPEFYFDVEKKVVEFLALPPDGKRVMLIQGGAGAGKTLFSRFIERHLWQLYHTNSFIPIFVSLPKAADPYARLIVDALHELGFNHVDPAHLLLEKFVFILDGLDELPLATMPTEGILATNAILAFPNAKVILTCRNHYLALLEQKFALTAHNHLTQHATTVEDVFMMPFDNSQINRYLAEHCRSPDAEWNDWKTFRHYIDTIPGLAELAQNPFMLKLLTSTLPRLLTTQGIHSRRIKPVDIFKAFTDLWFEREMWKLLIRSVGVHPLENRVQRYRNLSQRISQFLFSVAATSIHNGKLKISKVDRSLLSGLPINQQDGGVMFVHRSIQEFFAACAWIGSLSPINVNQAHDFFGARLASSETGMLKFIAQMYSHETHHGPLLNLVLASRDDDASETHITAAANAITVLNSVRFSFSGIDLSRVNISGAVLDNAMLHKTNLSNADLTGVSMKEVWAEGAYLSHATLSQVWFGREADIELRGECCGVATRPNKGFVALTLTGEIHTPSNFAGTIPVATVRWTCFTIHNDYLFAGSSEGNISVWDVANKDLILRSARVHSGKVLCITVQAGIIITGSSDKTICIFDMANIQVDKYLHGHTAKIWGVIAIPGRIISGGADSTICIWSIATGKRIHSVFTGAIVRCMIYHDGKLFAGTEDAQIQIWDAATLKRSGASLLGHDGLVTTLAHFEGKIISGSVDGTVRVWDISTGKQVGDMMAIRSPVVSVAVWDRKVYVGCNGNKLQVWDVSSKVQLQVDESLKGYDKRLHSIMISNGKIIVSGDGPAIQVIDVVSPQQLLGPLVEHKANVKNAAVYNNYIISAGDKELIKWDLITGEVISKMFTGHMEHVEMFGSQAVVAGWNGVRVHDVESGQFYTITKTPVPLMAVDEKAGFAAIFLRRKLELFDITAKKWIGRLNITTGVNCITCAKGYVIIGIGFSPDIHVWDAQTGIHIAVLRAHTQNVVRLATDGAKLVSQDNGNNVRVWNLVSFECICVVQVAEDITGIAVNSEWLAVAGGEPQMKQKITLRWWRVDEQKRQAYLAGMNPGRWPLNVKDCVASGVKGLTWEQRTLMRQLGAKNVSGPAVMQ